MEILGLKLSLPDFVNYAKGFTYGKVPPTSLVIHHTWSPTKAQWEGAKSIGGLKSYYEGKGWSAGPHLFVAEEGVWLFTPMNEVGIHADAGNATWTLLGKDYTGFRGPWGSKLKSCSIGIEVVGDYDLEKWSGETKANALGAIKCLMDTLGIGTDKVFFHRDFSPKTCPGSSITKDWLFAELAKVDADGNPAKPVVEPSSFAKEAWKWFQDVGFDKSVLPSQGVSAEAVAVYLKRLFDLIKTGR